MYELWVHIKEKDDWVCFVRGDMGDVLEDFFYLKGQWSTTGYDIMQFTYKGPA